MSNKTEYTQRFKDTWFSTATPVNAVKSSGILTVGGVVIEGETVTIGTTIGEFNAGGGVTAGNVDIDISAYTTASTGTLTIDTQPTDTNTMTIGTTVYTFKTDGTESAAGDISIGTSLATAQANIIAAINGTDALNSANAFVTVGAFDVADLTLTAISGGVAGDLIATTETFTAITNVFAAVELGSGADCTAANAILAMVAATDSFPDVVLTDGALDTLDVTALLVSSDGDLIATTASMANGAFAAVLLGGWNNATTTGTATIWISSDGVWYTSEKGVTKIDLTGWKSATPS